MRLWSIHPKYLDAKGLVALWRETLLARQVLRGRTEGYRYHPQLRRFRSCASPRSAVNRYLAIVYAEAESRGYRFDRSKLGPHRPVPRIAVTDGQLQCEWAWLREKLRQRSPALYRRQLGIRTPDLHPLFRLIRGPAAEWERVQNRKRDSA